MSQSEEKFWLRQIDPHACVFVSPNTIYITRNALTANYKNTGSFIRLWLISFHLTRSGTSLACWRVGDLRLDRFDDLATQLGARLAQRDARGGRRVATAHAERGNVLGAIVVGHLLEQQVDALFGDLRAATEANINGGRGRDTGERT